MRVLRRSQSLTTTESEARAMGFDVACGHITAAPYFQSVSGGRNENFVRSYKARYGDDEPTNMCAEAAYFQVHLFANALTQTNSIETDLIKPSVLGADYDAPQGRISVSAATSHTDLWSRVGRVDRHGQFEIVQQSCMPVSADPFLVGHSREIRSRQPVGNSVAREPGGAAAETRGSISLLQSRQTKKATR